VEIPGSKSHTIRAVAIASLAEGHSTIREPLDSADTRAAVAAYRALGAQIDDSAADAWQVDGFAGTPTCPPDVINVMNSGTTLRLACGSAALLGEGMAVFTGDAQIRRRPIAPLADALRNLGASVTSTRSNGCAPLIIGPKICGGNTSIEAVTSQYLSSLLINCPLAERDTALDVPVLHERPYVQITLDWLERTGVKVNYQAFDHFDIPGGQKYQPFDIRVPADFSSATFFLCAGAIGDNDVLVRGLDLSDSQGDKAVIDYLRQMGAQIDVTDEGVHVRSGNLHGCEIDLNATPDALPMMAALACFAEGTTRLVNVPQARLKETDRIAVMAAELGKMGATVRELEDGLVIERSQLKATDVSGHDDHRVVMALAVAGCSIAGELSIDTAEAVGVTFPRFVECMQALGATLNRMP
jgi:3-phosphoshikimate 1-carboxyvinyltransferase